MFGHYAPGQGYFGRGGTEGALLTQAVSGSVTPTGALSSQRVVTVALTATVGIAGAMTRMMFRSLTGAVGTVGTIAKHIARALAGFLTPSGALTPRAVLDSTVIVSVSGVERTSVIRHGSLEVEDVLNDAPNRCTFTVGKDWAPTEGQVVIITRGTAADLEFAGHIISVQQFYEGILNNTAYFVTCTDYTWKLDRRLITKRWVNVSATTIAQEIISGFTTGFTSTNVVGGLAVIPEFEVEEEDPSRALSLLAAEVGGSWYVDYELDLHFFLTESTDTPDDISDATLATTTARGLTHLGDLSQVRTSLRGTGAGASLLENIIMTLTLIPLETAAMFDAIGGLFRSSKGPNLGAYTGKHDGGLAAKVAGTLTSGAFPGGGHVAAVASGVVGVLQGVYTYKVAFANEHGETIPGAASNIATGVAFAAPGAGSVAAVSSTLGRLVGAYNYLVTFVTALGETTAGTTFGRTAVGATIPTTPSVAVTGSMGNLIGAYNYRTTFVGADGIESASSSSAPITANAASGPSAPSSITSNAPGPLGGGTYNWKASFVSADGRESVGSSGSLAIAIAPAPAAPSLSSSGAATISYRVSFFHPTWGETPWSNSATDTSSGGTVDVTVSGLYSGCGYKVYSVGSGHPSSDPYYHVATVNPGGSSTYTHAGASGSEASSPAATLGSFADMTIATGPTGTVARRIYRTKAGGSVYYLCGEIPDNSTTAFRDGVPDWDLTAAAPTANLNGQSINVTGIQTGPTGTIKRRLYRTLAGGSTFGLLAEIQNNTDTSFTDNIPDESLVMGISIPASAEERHGGQQHALTSLPTGPTGTLARRIYRTTAGGTEYKLLTEIPDNTTTSYTDNKSDGELGGESPPLVNTAGANKIAVTSIPTGGTGITKRILYRTEAGGSVYKYVATINDNVTTTYTDNTPDTSLGREAQVVNTIGVVPGDTSLLLTSVVGWPTAGWLKAGSQLIRWTGITGNALTGIPGARATTITRSGTVASATTTGSHGFTTGEVVTIQGAVESPYNGAQTITVTGATTFTYTVAGAPASPATGTITVSAVGAILATIAGGSGVVTAAFLSGVTGLVNPMEKGAPVRIYVVRNDTAAQTALAALEGGDGIHEAPLDDGSLMTVAALTAACDAELEAWSTKLRTITFKSRDPELKAGKSVALNMGAPVNQSGTFLIQRVISTEFDTAPGLNPLRDVIAAPVRLSFQDVIRRERNKAA